MLAATLPAVALDPKQPATAFLRHAFTTEDGLPSNVINSVLQTQDGFLIVGLTSGVFRFDGHSFSEMNADRPQNIIVHDLAQGPDGDLWVASRYGVYRIPRSEIAQRRQNLAVYHFGQGIADSVKCLHFTRAGVLWAGTTRGLFYFEKDHFRQVSDRYVVRMEEALDGHLYLVTTQGFIEWDGSRVIEHPEIPATLKMRADEVYDVRQDRSGAIWYCTAHGIFRRSGGSLQHFLPDEASGNNGAFRAYEDAEGNMWFLAAAGVFRASANSLERLAPEVNARALTADRDGNLWVGTNGAGLIRFKNPAAKTFTKADGLPNNLVMTVLAASDGKVWAGNNCGGVSWFDGSRFHTYDERQGLTNSCVTTLAEDSRHDLWVGTAGGGVFNFHAGHFRAYTKTDGLGSNTVTCILVARDGSLWIGTTGGVARLRDGVLRNYTTSDGLSDDANANVFQDGRGVVWASNYRGIDRFEGERFVAAFHPRDRGEMLVAGESPLGDLYVVLEPLGISRLKDGKLAGIAAINATQMHVVHHDLWFAGGTGGVTRIAADSLRKWEREQQEPLDQTQFARADGLLSEECDDGYPNMATTKDGKLWVATTGGAAMLDLSRLPPAASKPFIYISEIEVDRKKQSSDRELILPPGLHHTELRLSSIGLSSPERTHLQYRLEGIDSAWLDAKPAGVAVYTTIPHGTYLLHVRASNGEGVWDRQGIVYKITQEPFFYETAAFRIVMLAVGCILLTGVYRFRFRQASERMKMRLEERMAERERIARELHDTLLQGFQGLILRFQVVAMRIPETESTRRMMEESLDLADEVMNEGRERVKDLRAGLGRAGGLSRSLLLAGAEILSSSAMEISVIEEGQPRQLRPGVQDEAY